jgi:anti-sigma B factor antagonist
MRPDDSDFMINDPENVLDGAPVPDCAEVPEGDSGVLVVRPVDPGLLRITRDGSDLHIGFNEIDIVDDLCISGYREQIFRLLAENQGSCKLIFDVTNIKFLPSGMLGLLASVMKNGHNVEILNPSPDVHDVLHVTKLDEVLTIR